jgi:hypothetical protein
MIAEIREIYVRKDEIEANWEQGWSGEGLRWIGGGFC